MQQNHHLFKFNIDYIVDTSLPLLELPFNFNKARSNFQMSANITLNYSIDREQT